MSVERRFAWCDWIAGMTIGLMPLLAHFVLWAAAKGQPGWANDWTPDLLFITISNSGLAAVTVFARMVAGADRGPSLSPRLRVVWGFTLATFALASMVYGAVVTGMGNDRAWMVATVLLALSAYFSLIFELASANLRAAHRNLQ